MIAWSFSGVNMVKKHHQAQSRKRVWQGGIVEQEAPIQASNVAVFNSKSGKGERVGYRSRTEKKSAFSSRPAIWLTLDRCTNRGI